MINRALKRLPYTAWGNRAYWRLRFRRKHGRWPNGATERFTDQLYRIKTDGRLAGPLYRRCTDKETAKDYIADLTYPQGDGEEAPPLLADLLDIAARLAAPFPFIRVDLYASATEIRIGELTPCPAAANDRLHPDRADIELGALFGGE